MKLQLSELLELSPSLAALNAAKLPPKAGYRLIKAIALIEPEIRIYDQQRLKLAAELGELSEDKGTYLFPNPDNQRLFLEHMSALHSEILDLEFPRLQIDDLGTDLNIEPQLLRPLIDVLLFE